MTPLSFWLTLVFANSTLAQIYPDARTTLMKRANSPTTLVAGSNSTLSKLATRTSSHTVLSNSTTAATRVSSSTLMTSCSYVTTVFPSSLQSIAGTGTQKYCTCGETMAGINLATSGTSTTSYCALGTPPPAGFSQVPAGSNGEPAWQSKDCESPFFKDTTLNPSTRWASMFAEQAWKDAITYWNANQNTGLSFIQVISEFFNGPQGIECGKVADKNNCNAGASCTNGYTAAAWLVMESLVLVSDMNVNFYNALQGAETAITPDIGAFSGAFAPIDNSEEIFKTVLDFVALGAAVGLSPVWNSLLKNLQYFKANPNTLGTIKDSINPMISQSVTITKDNSAASSSIENTNKIDENMNGMVQVWQQTIDQLNTQLFNGSAASIDALHALITNGKMLSGDVVISDQDAQAPIEKTIYGYMIPQAWKLSNTHVTPFIVDTGAACDTPPKDGHVPAKALTACIDNKLYYIVSAQGPSRSCTATMNIDCDDNPFSNVPGGDLLDGKAWGGVTGADFVQSALAGKAANGGNNGWSMVDPTAALDNESDLLLNGNGIDMAGVTQIPICTDAEAFNNWNKGHTGANFPCNS